jgi:hypothetical protein
MPIYRFQSTDGTMHELAMAMSEVPSIGTTIEHPEFGALTRVVSESQISTNFTTWGYPYVSQSLPRNLPGCQTDSRGRPIITSRQHERNVASEHGYQRGD